MAKRKSGRGKSKKKGREKDAPLDLEDVDEAEPKPEPGIETGLALVTFVALLIAFLIYQLERKEFGKGLLG